jgi:2-oxoglutarate dehydrogenase E2 component (dihydrolipoamide succinyltransferase)
VIDVKVPAFSESVSEGTLLSWHKRPGDPVARGDVLVEVETDKVVLEISAQQAGVLTEIVKPEGAVVAGEEVIARLDPDATPAPAPAALEPAKAPPEPSQPSQPETPPLSPAVRKLVAERGLDPQALSGSGKGGRLTKADLPASAPAPGQPADSRPTRPASPAGTRSEQRLPMTRIRARIAERLKQAQNTAAILTTYNEVNMRPVLELRRRYQEAFTKKYGVKLGLMSFFVRAAVEALRSFPVVNASIDGQDVVYHGYFDIGIAVATERGLVVPILRDADRLSLAEIELAIADFAARAKSGKLAMEDLAGGTFSITNGGTFGSMMSTPILNPPQSAILGMHNILERPVVEEGAIVARPMMYLALSYDHRLIDGREAVLFLVAIKSVLEDPARILLGL